MHVTLIGILPPTKSLGPYCAELANSLSKKIKLDFINFKNLYPNFMYPGGIKDPNKKFIKPKEMKVYNTITYYNPFSWIKAGRMVKTNIVHIQFWSPITIPIYLTILPILRLRKKKLILTIHNVIPHESFFLEKFLTKLLFYFSNHFIVHSKENKKSLNSFFKIPLKKISVIPHGVFRIKKELVEKFEKEKGEKIILYFGIIRKYKGIDVLIKAFSIVNKKIKNCKLIIAGKSWINWSKNYRSLIEKYNLTNNITLFLDYIPNAKVASLFDAADVVVLPYTEFDAQSGVGSIAIDFNKPLIVSNVGGLPDFVKDSKAIFKSGDYRDLADKLIRVLTNKNLQKKLKKDAKILAEKYSWENVSNSIVKLYEDLNKQ